MHVAADCDNNNKLFSVFTGDSVNFPQMYNYAHIHVCMLPVSISYFGG